MEEVTRKALAVSRSRHRRLQFYALMSIGLSMFGHFFMGFDRLHALAYSVSAYVMLNALNHRAVLSRIEPQPSLPQRGQD